MTYKVKRFFLSLFWSQISKEVRKIFKKAPSFLKKEVFGVDGGGGGWRWRCSLEGKLIGGVFMRTWWWFQWCWSPDERMLEFTGNLPEVANDSSVQRGTTEEYLSSSPSPRSTNPWSKNHFEVLKRLKVKILWMCSWWRWCSRPERWWSGAVIWWWWGDDE